MPILNNTAIELEHILLELKNNRSQHLRHFVDQYFCYKNKYIKSTGNANWEGMVWNEHVSEEAQKLSNDKKGNRKKVVKEHVIPLKRLTQGLIALKNPTVDSIALYLDKHIIFATITKEEDKKLREAGLNSKMPKEYDLEGHELYKNPFARYEIVGIKTNFFE